jgi:hypothetical protein
LAGQPQQSSSAPAHRGGDGGASLVFWLLIALALAVFTPCMILPAWREYQAAELIERTRLGEVAAARAQLASLQRQLRGVREDPMVLARLARRELRAHAPDEAGWRVAPVAPPVTGAGDAQTGFAWASLTPTSAVTSAQPGAIGQPGSPDAPRPANAEGAHAAGLEPIDPPIFVARLARFLPPLDYDALFCARSARDILLAMSLALLAAAFAIFWPRCGSPTRK